MLHSEFVRAVKSLGGTITKCGGCGETRLARLYPAGALICAHCDHAKEMPKIVKAQS